MVKHILIFFILTATTALSGLAQQDTLRLRNGELVIGNIYAVNKYITKIQVDTGWLFIQNSELLPNLNDNSTVILQNQENSALSFPDFYVIPAGEFLVISTQRKLSTKYAESGEILECRLVQSLVDSEGRVILPENIPVIARVKTAKRGNAFRKAQLSLELIEIHLNAETIPISTNDQITVLDNYTAQRVLGSASTGSIIGGIFYDEWLNGALVGASIGLVSSLLIENKNIVIENNANLEFMVDQPLKIRIR